MRDSAPPLRFTREPPLPVSAGSRRGPSPVSGGQIYQRRAGRFEAEEAKNKFTCFREEILSLVREKGRMMATLANARGRLQVAIDGLWIDAEKVALDSVREHIGCMSTGGRWRRSPATDTAHRLGDLLRSGF